MKKQSCCCFVRWVKARSHLFGGDHLPPRDPHASLLPSYLNKYIYHWDPGYRRTASWRSGGPGESICSCWHIWRLVARSWHPCVPGRRVPHADYSCAGAYEKALISLSCTPESTAGALHAMCLTHQFTFVMSYHAQLGHGRSSINLVKVQVLWPDRSRNYLYHWLPFFGHCSWFKATSTANPVGFVGDFLSIADKLWVLLRRPKTGYVGRSSAFF